jgi:hypothetical protein
MEFEAERLGGLKVDHEFESGGLHHRQVGRLLALKNPPYVETGLAEGSGYAAAVSWIYEIRSRRVDEATVDDRSGKKNDRR